VSHNREIGRNLCRTRETGRNQSIWLSGNLLSVQGNWTLDPETRRPNPDWVTAITGCARSMPGHTISSTACARRWIFWNPPFWQTSKRAITTPNPLGKWPYPLHQKPLISTRVFMFYTFLVYYMPNLTLQSRLWQPTWGSCAYTLVSENLPAKLTPGLSNVTIHNPLPTWFVHDCHETMLEWLLSPGLCDLSVVPKQYLS